MAEAPGDDLVHVARIVRPWGASGEVKVVVTSGLPDRLRGYRAVQVRGVSLHVQRVRVERGSVVVKLRGVDSREEAGALRGAALEVPESSLPELPPDTYYHFQIVGLRVVTPQGEDLGEVADILSTGSNDVYVVKNATAEFLVPAIEDVVRGIDLRSGVVTIEPMPGLL